MAGLICNQAAGLFNLFMDRDELAAWLRLTLTPGVGNTAARRLLSRFGLPQTIFQQTEVELTHVVTEPQASALGKVLFEWSSLVEATWIWLTGCNDPGVVRTVVTLGDPRYPRALLDIEDPPLVLYMMGAPRWLAPDSFLPAACLAIVGSRNPTAQGTDNARFFSRALHDAGLTIVSGLALGVDAAAHEGALAASGQSGAFSTLPTIAVVGTGLDRVYPRRNLALAREIAANGLLISEYPLGTPPHAANFPKRNRIISGLSQGTLVVEAALASGSLITARTAVEQGREVFAIPGSIHSPQSRGCHLLIRQGAKLVESAQDVLEELRLPAAAAVLSSVDECRPELRPADGALLQAIGYDPVGIDALVGRTGMDAASLQVELLKLELAGQVARLPGGLFQRMATS